MLEIQPPESGLLEKEIPTEVKWAHALEPEHITWAAQEAGLMLIGNPEFTTSEKAKEYPLYSMRFKVTLDDGDERKVHFVVSISPQSGTRNRLAVSAERLLFPGTRNEIVFKPEEAAQIIHAITKVMKESYALFARGSNVGAIVLGVGAPADNTATGAVRASGGSDVVDLAAARARLKR